MKLVYVRNLCKYIWKYRVLILILAVISAAGFAGLGMKVARSSLADQQTEQMQVYEQTLQEYDDIISNMENSIEIESEQIDDIEQYIEGSDYMKLNPSDIQVAVAQYMVRPESGENKVEDAAFIAEAWAAYINEGSFYEALAEKAGMDSADLGEIIDCAAGNNVFVVSVMHYESAQAKKILETSVELIDSHISQMQEMLGEFSLVRTDMAEYAKADVGVQNAQNQILTELKNHESRMADLKDLLVGYQSDRDTYAQTYRPSDTGTGSAGKMVVEYMVMGILCGIILPVAVLTLLYVASDRLKSREEMMAAGVAVLGIYSQKRKCAVNLDRSLLDIEVLAARHHMQKVFFYAFGSGEAFDQMVEGCRVGLQKHNIEVCVGSEMEDTGQLKSMLDAGNCIFIAEVGSTTYAQIEDQRMLCDRFEIPVWGCMIIG